MEMGDVGVAESYLWVGEQDAEKGRGAKLSQIFLNNVLCSWSKSGISFLEHGSDSP